MRNQLAHIKDPKPKTKDRIAAIILAAGRSRRMGAFKPLLPFGNESVIATCVHNLRAAGVGEIVVVIGHRGEEVRRHLQTKGVTFATNPNADSQMSASIGIGVDLISSTAKAVLILPVDHPAVPPEIIERLIEKWHAGTRLVQPEYQSKGGHPVLVDISYRHELLNLDPEMGLRGFFGRHHADALRLPVDAPFVARDMDTWDDYVHLHYAVFGRKPREIADLHG